MNYSDNDEKIMIAMDYRNVNTPLRGIVGYSANLDYSILLGSVLGGRKSKAAFAFDSAYTVNGRDTSQEEHDMLREAGFTVRLSETPNRADKQGHVDMAMGFFVDDYVKDNGIDVVELITGDGDFTPLVERLQRRGVKVRIHSFKDCMCQIYHEKSDGISYLDPVPMIEMGPVPTVDDTTFVNEEVTV